jgi:hypothetical protein
MTDGRMRFDLRSLIVGALVLGSMFCQTPNREPGVPSTPAGPSSGIIGPRYTFQSIAADPDTDKLSYRFDWGDGDTSDWIGAPWQQAGAATHDWSAPGTYTLRAQAQDGAGLVSGWSDGHQFGVASISAWTFGGEFGDGSASVQQTTDGGYVFAGFTIDSASNYDAWLVKIDALGNKVWDRAFGGAGWGGATSVRQTTDGGYILVGYTGDTGAAAGDVLLVRTDASGSTVWSKVLGGADGDGGSEVQPTSDGGYIITGYTGARGEGPACDAWLVKTDGAGNEVWSKVFGGTGLEGGNSVQQTTDGGYIVVGYTCTSASDAADVWLIKTDSSGEKVWDRTFGGTAEDHGSSVRQTTDGGYVVTGFTVSRGAGDKDVWLIKTDASGNEVWDKTFGGADWDEGNAVQQTSDGGYIITGFTRSFGAGEEDVWLIKADASGNKVWDRTFGGSSTDEGNSLQQTSDGGYIVAGNTYSYGRVESDVWLIKTDANGQ